MEGLGRSLRDAARSRWTLAFTAPEIERAFLERYAAIARRQLRFALPFVIVLWLWASVFDHQLLEGDRLTLIRWLRFAFALPLMLGTLALAYAPDPTFRRLWQAAVGASYGALGITIVIYATLGTGTEGHLGTTALALTILGGCTLVGLRFVTATAISAVITIVTAVLFAQRFAQSEATSWWVQINIVLLVMAACVGMLVCYQLEASRRDNFVALERVEALLGNTLPREVVRRLIHGERIIVDSFPRATVLFADLVGFTALAERIPPRELVTRLNDLYTRFDRLAEQYGLEKIKTIGDGYLVVSGVPRSRHDDAEAAADMALAMLEQVRAWRDADPEPLQIRIGMHTGPVVAGVIGATKLSYDVWGDTVNIASRMQSHGLGGAIQVSAESHRRLARQFVLDARGEIQIKGRGQMEAYMLRGRRTGAPPRPDHRFLDADEPLDDSIELPAIREDDAWAVPPTR